MEGKIGIRVIVLILVWVVLLVVSLAFLSGLVTIFSNPQFRNISSPSWAGYIVNKNFGAPQLEVNGVDASWIVPKVNASAGDGYSSAWIGIGGQGESTLIQVGTEQDVLNGRESYVAWYELLPSYAVTLTDMTVSPGDTIIASINLVDSATNEWNIHISDATTGQVFDQNFVYESSRLSGEWIVERPTINSVQSPTMPDFGSVTFTGCNINVSNTTGVISKFSYSGIQMITDANVLLASISPLSADGSSFTVSFVARQ